MARVKITDTTFRDAHQSLLATRLRTEDMVPIAAEMGAAGFHSMEVWGGATFDAATRFLAEDPWERLLTFKRLIPSTPLMMLLRGQSLVGYRNYADDVVEAFVKHAAETGTDVFRVFDALNDERNLEMAAKAVKASGGHLQMAICYSVTEEGRLGGPIYNLDYYTSKAKLFQQMGADSIAIKDMAGLLAPYDAYELVKTLKGVLKVPLQLHTHYTSGMASMSCLKAIDAGIDVVDACLAPLALRTAQPAVESLVMALRGTEREPALDLDRLIGMGDYLETVLPRYASYMESPTAAVIDPRVLTHQIPGGMASNLTSQLREAGALDRLPEVLEEIPRTRKELGYPPLVTPTSQMVGTQAVNNVLFGRYKMVLEPVKDYVQGLYGRPPAPLDPDVAAEVLEGDERADSPITGHAADTLEPELDKARDSVKDITTEIGDILTYALYPTTGMAFLRMKHGLDPVPDAMRPTAPEDADGRHPAAKTATPPRSSRARSFNIYVGDDHYQVEVDPVGPEHSPTVRAPALQPAARVEAPAAVAGEPRPIAPAAGETALAAPMPGLVLRYDVVVGQPIEQGDPVVVLEAMKMESSIPSPVQGIVKALPFDPGATVARGDPLAIIAT